MAVSLVQLVPNVADLLALEVEELGVILLVHLNSHRPGDADAVQHGSISQHNFFNDFHRKPPYDGVHKDAVRHALMEAFAWLQSTGFLIPDPQQDNRWSVISRRGRQVTSREAFEAYRSASLLPRAQLHPLIASRVYPAFLRGEYDTAVFQAYRDVEIAVRTAGKFPPEMIGVALMRAAFRPAGDKPPGPLTDAQLPVAEQEAVANLFAGALGLYKNPAEPSPRLTPQRGRWMRQRLSD